jgi:outer membrane protein/protease secretion system outer membrane protein
MTLMRKTLVAAALAGLAVVQSAWSMDLLQAYEAALEHDATVRAARAAADSSRERLPQARAQLRPNIGFSAQRSKNDLDRTQNNILGVPSTTNDKYFSSNQTLSLRQPIYRKNLFAATEQAGYLVEDANALLDRELQNLGVRVGTAYLELLMASDQLALVLAQKRVTQNQLEAARKAFAAGSATRTDIDEAQARLDMILAQELEVRQSDEFARRELQVLTNQPVDKVAPLDAARLKLETPVPATLEEWIREAEEKNPEMRSLRARVEASRLEVVKARSGHLPTLDATAQVIRSSSENVTSPSSSYTNRVVGLQLNVPLYAGGGVESAVRQALADQLRAEELLEATRRDLGVRVHKEFRGIVESVLKAKALEQAVRSTEQLVLSSRKSFAAGSRTVIDVLNAEQQKQQALRDLAQTRYVYLAARIRLLALAGADARKGVEETNVWLAH